MKEIEKIVECYQKINWEKEQAALGTVVKVEGSAYRRIGARMFVNSNGQWVGGISGGCLEGDALKQAQIAMMKNKSSIVVYDTMEDDPHQIGVGLGCNGRIEVLLTPIEQQDKGNQLEFLQKIIHQRHSTILLQILNTNSGNALLRGKFFTLDTLEDLSTAIDVDLEALETKIQTVFYKRKSKVFTLVNAASQEYEILFEIIHPKIKLVCIGDNYDVDAFMRIANELGWEIHVAGKQRKLSKVVYQIAKKVYSLEEAKGIEMDEYTAVVLMSHDYKTDLSLLQTYINKDIPYIGLLGPKKRMLKMQEELSKNGVPVDLERLSNLYSPIGLDIGAENPEEIALSIAAEIVAVFRERNGAFLKTRTGTINDRS
jgi:xanthine dehydrogenase accessory factor